MTSLDKLIKQQESWAQELRTMAEEARQAAEQWRERATEVDSPALRSRYEADAKGRIAFAARFEHMAAEVEADIVRLQEMNVSGNRTST